MEAMFPHIGAHCVSINGFHLMFSPAGGIPLLVNEAAAGLVTHCSGMSLSESREWLRRRYGRESAYIADEFMRIVEAGYFTEPRVDFDDTRAGFPMVTSFGVGITHRCNMGCRYCFAAASRSCDMPADISPDTARAAVDLLFDTLQPPWVRISLGVTGEPQLRWDAVQDIITYARRRSDETGIPAGFIVTTNGVELRPEMLDYLRDHHDLNIALSWDGPEEIHNRQRVSLDGSDTYERVSGAFQTLRGVIESRPPVVMIPSSQSSPMVVATVSGLNPDLAGIFMHLFDKGVRDLCIKPARVTADPAVGLTEESLPAFKAGYDSLAAVLLQPGDDQIERLYTILAQDDFLGRYILRISNNIRSACRCNAGRSHFEVDTNGDIYPCPSLVGMAGFHMGNVHTDLDERKAKSFREHTFCPNIQACRSCWARYLCGGPCVYVSAQTSGRSDIPYAPECDLTKHLIELAGYIVARLRMERPGLLEQALTLRSAEIDLHDDLEAEHTPLAADG